MNAGEVDFFSTLRGLDFNGAALADGQFKLRDLITFRKVRVEVMFSRKNVFEVDFAAKCQTELDRKGNGLLVQNR